MPRGPAPDGWPFGAEQMGISRPASLACTHQRGSPSRGGSRPRERRWPTGNSELGYRSLTQRHGVVLAVAARVEHAWRRENAQPVGDGWSKQLSPRQFGPTNRSLAGSGLAAGSHR